MCESGLALSEIGYMIKHVRQYARRKFVYTPLSQFASTSYKLPTPYGNVLIMSPWNYPFLLSIEPLCNAIASGNTAVVKPSAYSPATSRMVERIITECFQPQYVAVVTGGRKENAELLNQKFDFVFFTGSQSVGREVLRHTAETLTPAVLLVWRGVALASLLPVFASSTAVNSFTMAQQMGGDAELAGNIVVATSALCSLTMFFWCFLFKSLGMI